jgi:pimeloyl-ACP methyl ester carboxylesterase
MHTSPSHSRLSPLTLLLLTALCLTLCFGGPALADTEEQFFDSDGVKIRYLVEGQGEPLILIHGFSASAESNWVLPGVFNKLSEAFQVIAIDNRGHGKSDKPHDKAAYGTVMVDDVIRLMDHLDIEKAHVAGYSMGGFLTMKLIASHPDRLLSAIVGAAGWAAEGDDTSMQEELAQSLEQGTGITPLLLALNPADAPPMSQQQIDMANNMVMAQNDPLALAAAIRGMVSLSVSQKELEGNEVPTLAIIGSRDPLKAGVDAMTPHMQNLEVHLIEGADHMTALMNPEYSAQLADGMLEFLIALCKCA